MSYGVHSASSRESATPRVHEHDRARLERGEERRLNGRRYPVGAGAARARPAGRIERQHAHRDAPAAVADAVLGTR